MSKGKKRTEDKTHLTVRIPVDMFEYIEDKSFSEEKTRTDAVIELLQQGIDAERTYRLQKQAIDKDGVIAGAVITLRKILKELDEFETLEMKIKKDGIEESY